MVQNILDYLEATAADCPDKPAFEDLEHSYTFAQVLGNAKRIGSALLQVLPQNAPVPVLMEKEAWTLNVFMGAVCAGCFYTLVEPEQPDERIRTILDTLEAEVIVTSGKLSERVAALGFTGKVLLAEELMETADLHLRFHRSAKRCGGIPPFRYRFYGAFHKDLWIFQRGCDRQSGSL